jgi:hypothetical protein
MRLRMLGVALPAFLLLPAGHAAAAADIEAVWSFTGGQVAVQAQSDGSFLGTVIRATRFANCPHPVGESIWTGVRAQPDGQYHGGHQWYRDADCSAIPQRGRTAFRVLSRPDGGRFLRVCFAPPERPELQPTIAPGGSSANAPGGCSDSDLVAPLSTRRPTVDTIATLPKQGRRRCLSRRSFRIRLKEPPGDALSTAAVFVNGKRVEVRRGERITAPINLRGLPRGRYTVKITARTVLGRTITGTRKYRTCSKRRRGGGGGPV